MQDLEKQVRDRLGLDWFNHLSSKDPPDTEKRILQYHKREKQQENEPTSLKSISVAPSVTDKAMDEHTESPSHPTARKVTTSHTVLNTDQPSEESTNTVVSQPAKQATATVQKERKTVTLKDYVHDKYGVPMEQLSHLLSTGLVNSIEVDTSGCGRGPLIRAPVEASLLLPTPVHTPNTTSGLEPHTSHPSLTSHISHTSNTVHSAVSTENGTRTTPPTHTTQHPPTPHAPTAHLLTPHSHMVHHPSTPLTQVCSSDSQHELKFEARFESGNLDKAKPM